MPIVKIIEGDLIEIFKSGDGQRKFDAIAHGANCFHTMGAGIAKGIAINFPEAVAADIAHHQRGDLLALGQYSAAKTPYGYVLNLYSQFTPGKVPASGIVKSVGLAFGMVNSHTTPSLDLCADPRRPVIGIPLIGAGIAGGVWADIAERIDQVTPNLEIILVKYVMPPAP